MSEETIPRPRRGRRPKVQLSEEERARLRVLMNRPAMGNFLDHLTDGVKQELLGRKAPHDAQTSSGSPTTDSGGHKGAKVGR